jgi:radical SAM protein with 4Fe4S-binding SPASM domain
MSNDWQIDSHKLHLHPDRVAQWLAADTWEKAKKVMPIYFEVTPSAACNHRCKFCSVDTIGYKGTPSFIPLVQAPHDGNLIDPGLIIERMAESARLGVKSVMFAGTGEPLAHKRISDIILGAQRAGLDTAFTTNGTLISDNKGLPKKGLLGCSWIKVSLNAGTAVGYANMHRTSIEDWHLVWANIKVLVAMRNTIGSKTTIGIQCVVLPDTVYEMDDLCSEARAAGVDYLVLKPYSQGTFQTSHEYDGTTYENWEKYLGDLVRFETDTFKVIVRMNAMKQEARPHEFKICRATPNFWVYSMANGDVFTCSDHLTEKEFCIGNLYKNTFQEIWEGEGRRANWEMMKSFDIQHCRLNCRMSLQNQYLEQFSTVRHISFI